MALPNGFDSGRSTYWHQRCTQVHQLFDTEGWISQTTLDALVNLKTVNQLALPTPIWSEHSFPHKLVYKQLHNPTIVDF